jgi:hypothetical protein
VTFPDGVSADVSHTTDVPAGKLPFPGQYLPVTVSESDPARMRVEWDDAPEAADRARASADAAERGDAAGAAEALGFTLLDPDGS